MRRLTIIIALIISINQLNANDLVTTIEANINWETPIDRNGDQVFVFENANYDANHRTLPLYIQDIPLNTYGDLSVEFTDVVYEPLEKNSNTDDEFLSNDLEVNTSVGLARRKPIGQFSFIPIRKTLMGYEKVVYNPPTHLEIAISANTARQTTTTLLLNLRENNIIHYTRQYIVFRDLEKIKKMMTLDQEEYRSVE